ncbi:MAG: VOC family protein [Nocardioides sp.]|nr:VOC family protein [Nocardioides sp.]
MSPSWVTAFLDLADDDFTKGVVFWAEVTGYGVSAPRGEGGEFATLVPRHGTPFLRVQKLDVGPSRIHLDLHVDDPRVAAEAAVFLGARVVHLSKHGYVVMTSPAGFTFCFVRDEAATRPEPATWPGGRSIVDQVCLDIAPSAYEIETAFWRDLTGWEPVQSAATPHLSHLRRPTGQPLRLLLQRLDEERPMAAHLDLAADDRAAETERHLALGARLVGREERWTVLTDPAGSAYCITDRDPQTGLLA